jgi:exodeoxyribonuclease VII small subunit
MSTAKSDADTVNPDFGAKLKELEAVTTWFESGEVDLSAALAKFERGMQLADELKQELQKIENRVEKIKAKFDTSAAAANADTALAAEELLDGDGPTLF